MARALTRSTTSIEPATGRATLVAGADQGSTGGSRATSASQAMATSGSMASAVLPFIDKVELILVMTVEPGFGGQKFMADMMPKVKKIRQMLDEVNPACIIEVDGGVDAVTYRTCRENGAEALVTGSAYFKAADRAAFVKALRA